MSEIGTVVSKELGLSDLEAGLNVILKEKERFVGVVNLQHINVDGYWYVTGNVFTGKCNDEHSFHVLYIEDGNKKLIGLSPKYWNSITHLGKINSGVQVTFERETYPFVEGDYSQICRLCESDFMAHKRQRICKDCAEKLTQALILGAPKKKQTIDPSIPTQLMRIAYNAGQNNEIPFDEWFNVHYEDF